MTRRNPDAEVNLMHRMWLDLEAWPVEARRRILVYLFARCEAPQTGNGVDHDQQQVEEAARQRRAQLGGDLLAFR